MDEVHWVLGNLRWVLGFLETETGFNRVKVDSHF
jgi:hypothetical protein